MDLTPEISDEMIKAYADAHDDAWLMKTRPKTGESMWPYIRAGLEAVAPMISEAAYRAGREDAAREVAAAGEGWDDARDAYWHMVNKAEGIRGADQPRKLAGSAGDNPEEQRPALGQERSDGLRCHTWVTRPTSPEPFWCNKVVGHSGPHGRVEEQRP